jgi:DNA-binding CsgD family transcriptional regulator
VPVRAQPALLERETELAELEVALEDARGGVGRLVLIEGAAGIGKTRLLGEARRAAADSGMRVLTARGTELERDFPFALVRQLFESALKELEPTERAELLAGAAAPAGRVIGLGEAGPDSLADSSFATLNALYWLTSNLAEGRPTLLAVDDAHWSDLPSLRFFRFMLPRLEDLPVLVAITARPPAADAAPELLGELLADPATSLIRPRGLSREGVAELVSASLDSGAHEDFVAACHEATGGNPFMLRELLSELVAEDARGSAEDAVLVRDVAPSSVQRAVLVRLARLPAGAHDLARAVAILGDDVPIAEAAELAGLPPAAAADNADALTGAGILDPGRPLRFVHPLLRTAVYADMAGGVKAAAHARAAALLEEHGAEPERIAVHLLATDPGADPQVVALLESAALRALDRAAPESAAAYLRRALAEQPPKDVRLELLRLLLRAYSRAGDRVAFQQLFDAQAFEALFGEPQVLLDSATELAHLLNHWGLLEEMTVVLQRATELAIETAQPDRAAVFQANLAFYAHVPPVAALARLEEHKDAIEPGTPSERLFLALEAEWRLRSGASRATVIDLARRALLGEPLWPRDSDNHAPRIATYVLRCVDELDAAERAMDEQASAAGVRGAWSMVASAWERGELAYLRGEVAASEGLARTAVEIIRQSGYALPYPNWLALLVEVLVERDDLAGAQAELETAGLPEVMPDTWWFGPLLSSRARLRLAEQRPGEALADVLASLRGDEAAGVRREHLPTCSYLALAHHATGDRAQALRVATDELENARAWGLARRTGIALRTLGLIDGGETGLELLRESLDVLERSPAKLEHARSLVDYGAALRRANRRAEAREPLRAGLEWARRTGALAIARRAHEELAATGEKLRPLSADGAGSLTPSERRVADLAAGGQTNREIAQGLFLSVKTVETHLSSVYRKLDVASRRDLAAALAA